GVGAAALAEHVSIQWRKSVLVAFLALAILFEFRVAPFSDFFQAEIDPPPVYHAIKELPMKGGLVELPVSFYGIFYYTMRAADHLRPVVVATSSFGSPVSDDIQLLTQRRPIPDEFLDYLEAIPTSYIIVHEEFLNWEDLDERRALHDVIWRGIK